MHLGVSLFGGHARLEARREVQPFIGVVVRSELLRVERERRPDVGSSIEEGAEARRHDPKDDVTVPVELHRLADSASVAAVDALPESVAEDDDAILPLLVLVSAKDSA